MVSSAYKRGEEPMMKTNDALRAALFGAALLGAAGVAVAEETKPYKVFLSMS